MFSIRREYEDGMEEEESIASILHRFDVWAWEKLAALARARPKTFLAVACTLAFIGIALLWRAAGLI